MKKKILFVGIFLLAFILRTYQLDSFPKGFFADEAAIPYSGYKILTTGKDEHGVSFPFFFQSLGEYRNPVSVYSSIPFVFFFGLSEFSSRLVTAVYGTLTVFVIFLLVRELSNNKTGLIASFLLAVSAWHIHISRWGAEYAPFPFFVCLACLFIVLSFKKKWWIIPSAIVSGIGLYTYYPAWIVIPILFLSGCIYWIIINRKKMSWTLVFGIVIFMLSLFPLAIGIRKGYALTRWDNVEKTQTPQSEKIKSYLHFYLDHFSPFYLFVKGDLDYPGRFITRQFVKSEGFLYKFTAPFILIGLLVFFIRRKKGWVLLVILILIYPLGSALTFEGPMSTRSIVGVLPFMALCAIGIADALKLVKNRRMTAMVLTVVITLFCSLETEKYLTNYYKEYPLISSDFWGWQYGPKEILSYYAKVESKYDALYMAGEFNGAEIFIPFYTAKGGIPCHKCFGGGIEKLDLRRKQLFAASPSLLKDWKNSNYHIMHTLYYPDGNIAFNIVQYY